MSEFNTSIFRFHVRINGKRTTISLDPDLFRALTFKLGSADQAKEWISTKAMSMSKTNKSISRQIQSAISLFLVDLSANTQPVTQNPIPNKEAQTFTSDSLPI